MKTKLSFLIAILFFALNGYSQCPNDNVFYIDISPAPNTTITENCVQSGKYITTNVIDGHTYEFSLCDNLDSVDTQLSLYSTTGTVLGYNDDFCDVYSKIIWVATFTGSVRLIVDDYNCTSISSNCKILKVIHFGIDTSNCPINYPIICDAFNFTVTNTNQDASALFPNNNYNCLVSSPSPSWFYFKIGNPGNLNFNLSAPQDIDYILYGPFADLATADAACGVYGTGGTNGNVISCGYSASSVESVSISGATTDQVYILLVTNFAGTSQTVDVTAPTGGGTFSCGSSCTPPEQPTIACYETATLNTTTCSWEVTGTQPEEPTIACYETATFNTTTCSWDVTGTQPEEPTIACYETATFNTTTCSWEVTGTQPEEPTTACYETATFNTTTCSWDVAGTQPEEPTTACYETATFNTTTCSWDVAGTQPEEPTTACYETATFNTTTCSWEVTGTQPEEPTTACYETATFNTTTCTWEVTGTQPEEPTTACYETATFNTTTCSWDVTGAQPEEPTTACYETATFNTTTCSWEVTGTQPEEPTTACYETATFNTTTCSWEVTGTAPATPTGDANQTISVNNANDATLANLVVTPAAVTWYATLADAQAGTNALANTTVLTNGFTYYAVNVVGSCSSTPLAVTVSVTLGNEEFDNLSLVYWPNPTSSIVNISYSKIISQLSVTNILGQQVLSKEVNSTEAQIDFSGMAEATYFIKIFSEGMEKVVKVIKID